MTSLWGGKTKVKFSEEIRTMRGFLVILLFAQSYVMHICHFNKRGIHFIVKALDYKQTNLMSPLDFENFNNTAKGNFSA